MSTTDLPVILVSATNIKAAEFIISEITKGSESVQHTDSSRIWSISNKYYNAKVRLMPHIYDKESVTSELRDLIEAHVVYLHQAESETSKQIAGKAVAACGILPYCEVNLVVAGHGIEGDELVDWCHLQEYEFVKLTEEEKPDDSNGEGEEGIARVIEALHAHTWSSLERLGAEESNGSESALERVERFAELLGSLQEARNFELPRQQRQDYAEELVYAFCKALVEDDNEQLNL